MYALTVSVNGEVTRSNVYASVIDATNDYLSAIGTGPDDVTSWDVVQSALIAQDVSVSADWDVPNPASDAGDGPTDSDMIRVSVFRVSGEDIDPETFVASRAVVIMDEWHASVDAIEAAIAAGEASIAA